MTNLPKIYAPQEIEGKWYQFWQKNGYFHAEAISDKPPYAIVIPPPNITGSLHIGHALDNTLQDCLIRWRRMQGYNALWMPGTDHAGIVTELIMERKLAEEGTSKTDLGREKFTERMWQWKDESAGYIVSQLQQLGCSCDWERERFTLDEGLSKAVRTAFVKLYDQGLIYHDTYMGNWCPYCNTGISNLEVEPIEIDGHFYHILYPVKDSEVVLEIATTRPETMLGDTAVAVHPEDERYQHLIGKTALLPLCDREIPIIADAYVDREFGTGALKVTPAHDTNDYEIGGRHDLEQLTIFTPDGYINENAPERYVGLSRWDCRKRVVEDLQDLDALVKIVPHRHAVGHHDRCGTVVEPAIFPQWFMNVRPLAQRAIEAARRKAKSNLSQNGKRLAFITGWRISNPGRSHVNGGGDIGSQYGIVTHAKQSPPPWKHLSSVMNVVPPIFGKKKTFWTHGSALGCGPSLLWGGRKIPKN